MLSNSAVESTFRCCLPNKHISSKSNLGLLVFKSVEGVNNVKLVASPRSNGGLKLQGVLIYSRFANDIDFVE